MYLNEFKDIPLVKSLSITKRQSFLLTRLNIISLYDLINYFPFRYEDRSQLSSIQDSVIQNKTVTIIVRIIEHNFIYFNGRRHPKILIQDEQTRAYLIGFNRDYLRTALKIGNKYWVSAQFNYKYNEIQASAFDFEEFKDGEMPKNFGKILPVYQLTENLYIKEIRNIMNKGLNIIIEKIDDELPSYILQSHKLISKKEALKNIHFPADKAVLNKSKIRLAFEEFLAIQIAVTMKKQNIKSRHKQFHYDKKDKLNTFIARLPYKLTKAQIRVIDEIVNDMNSSKAMHRLLQGDVGCGKTIVAFASMIYAADNGYQSALMVPTEVLAIQHFNIINSVANEVGLKAALLTGSMSGPEKDKVCKDLSSGTINLIVGTHALLQETVLFQNLKLIVFDEQHKFGVEQRINLSKKGDNPDILVMTATPIPRTLTLTIYGDLDVSIIDELPSERRKIITKWIIKNEYASMIKFVSGELSKGRQAYFVYPLIEESEIIEAENAIKMAGLLKKYFPSYKIGLLHGRMVPSEKYGVMEDFRNQIIDILVSTTVIEVGIDIKNASVMVIEGAERFGLSQLHQLRGRVGRGIYQSYCVLVTGKDTSDETRFRMQTMVQNSDGFKIAEEDLKLRGPGEILGIRQSGLPELKIADYMRDEKLLIVAKNDASNILKDDPGLNKNINKPLKNGIINFLPSDYLYSG